MIDYVKFRSFKEKKKDVESSAVGVKGLAQGHLSGDNERGASACMLLSLPRFIWQRI